MIVLARREGWVLTTAELRRAGCTASRQRGLRDRGWLTKVFRGVHLVGRSTPTRDELERAAVKACGDGAVLSHRSAAVRWRLRRTYRGPVEVTAPSQRRHRRGLRAYHAALDPRDVTIKDGVPITTLARTLIDLAGVESAEAVDHAVHEAENARRLRVREVDGAIGRAGRRPGLPALRRALDDRRANAGGLKRDLERRFHRFLHRHGFPPSEHNVLVEVADGDMTERDVYFRAARLGVELDAGPHMTVRRFHRDRRIDRRLEARGIATIRVTHDDLDHREDEVAADLWAALAARSA